MAAQAESIELLYNQAVQSLGHVTKGNVHLKKANAASAGARLWTLYALLAATIALLLADWLSS